MVYINHGIRNAGVIYSNVHNTYTVKKSHRDPSNLTKILRKPLLYCFPLLAIFCKFQLNKDFIHNMAIFPDPFPRNFSANAMHVPIQKTLIYLRQLKAQSGSENTNMINFNLKKWTIMRWSQNGASKD